MLRKSKMKITLVISLVLFCSTIISIESFSNIEVESNLRTSGFWELSPIYIDDWNKTANENDWCRGNGTFTNPYIIENITINANYLRME